MAPWFTCLSKISGPFLFFEMVLMNEPFPYCNSLNKIFTTAWCLLLKRCREVVVSIYWVGHLESQVPVLVHPGLASPSASFVFFGSSLWAPYFEDVSDSSAPVAEGGAYRAAVIFARGH